MMKRIHNASVRIERIENHGTFHHAQEFITFSLRDLKTFDHNHSNQDIVEDLLFEIQWGYMLGVLRLEDVKYLIKEHIYALKIQSIVPKLKNQNPITLMNAKNNNSTIIFIKGNNIYFLRELQSSIKTGNFSTDKNIFLRITFKLGKSHPLRDIKGKRVFLHIEDLYKHVMNNPSIIENSILQKKLIEARRSNIPIRKFLDREVNIEYKKPEALKVQIGCE